MPKTVERPHNGVHCQFNDAVSCKHNGVYLSLCLAGEISKSAEEISVVVYVPEMRESAVIGFSPFVAVKRTPHHMEVVPAVRVFLLHENCDTAQGGCYQYTRFS